MNRICQTQTEAAHVTLMEFSRHKQQQQSSDEWNFPETNNATNVNKWNFPDTKQ